MPGNSSISQSNIFGDSNIINTPIAPQSPNNQTTAAGKLIEKLKYITDSHLTRVTDRSNWLGIAANAGQNEDGAGLVKGQLKKPEKLKRVEALAKWDLPAITASPLTLPTLPDNLKVDLSKLQNEFKNDLDKMTTGWMAKFIPEASAVNASGGGASINDLITKVLNSDYYNTTKTDLKALADDVKEKLKATMDRVLAIIDPEKTTSLTSKTQQNIDTNLEDVKTDLADNLSTAKAAVATNLLALRNAIDQAGTGNLVVLKANLAANLAALETSTADNLETARKAIDENIKALQEAVDNSSSGYLATTKKNLADSLAALKDAINNPTTGNLAVAKAGVDASLARLVAAIAAALAVAKANVNTSYTNLKAVLLANQAALKTNVATGLATTKADTAGNLETARTNLTANVTTAKAGAADALTVAKDNTAGIAWVRARDQVSRESARLETEAVRSFAGRGFTLPTGALAAQLAKARQASLNAAAEAAAVQAEKSQQFFFDVARSQVETFLRAMEAQVTADMRYLELQNGAALRALELLEAADLRVLELQDNAAVRVMELLQAADLKYLDLEDVANIRAMELRANADLRALELKDDADLKAMELRDTADTRVLGVKTEFQTRAMDLRNQVDVKVLEVQNNADMGVLERQNTADLRVTELKNSAELRALELKNESDLKVLDANDRADLRTLELQNQAEVGAYEAFADANLRYAALESEALRSNAQRAFDHLGLTLDFTKFGADLGVKYRLGVIDGVNNLVRAYSGLRSNEAEWLGAIERAQREAQQSVLDYYRAAMAAAEIGMRLDVTNNENDLRWATIAAQFIGTAVGHHVQAATASADVFARTAGMALSSMNGIASVSASD